MCEARQRTQWRRTSSILALLANQQRDPKKRRKPFTPDDFDPWTAGRRTNTAEAMPTDWKILGLVWSRMIDA
jgi:hypothetical protein